MKDLFINRNFFLLWVGKLVSQIGDKFYSIALAWWILQKTNSPLIMGLLMAASILPGLIIAPLAGAFIDRWYRKPVIIIADIARGIFVTAVAGLSVFNLLEIWHVFTAAVIISLGSSFYDPAVQAVIPQIVPKEKLPKANGFSRLIGGVGTVLGPVLGAVTVSFCGFTVVFLINGLSYLVSAFCGWLMAIPLTSGESQEQNRATWNDIKAGLNYLTKQKRLLIIIGIIGTAHFFVGSLMVSLPFLAKQLTGNGVQNLGYLETLMGLGLILGSVYISLKKQKELRDVYLFLLMMMLGFCYLMIGMFKVLNILSIIPYLILMLLIGAAIANASVYWQSLLQMNTPNDMAGRVFSISSMAGNISLPLAFGIFGLLLNYHPLMLLMSFSGFFLLALSLILLVSYRRAEEWKPETARNGSNS